jgi:hypothetical protein
LFTRESEPKEFGEEEFSVATSADFQTTIEDAENDFTSPLQASSTTPETYYTLGDPLYKSDGTKFRLPTPNSFGMCDETRSVKFLDTMNTTGCTRITTYQDCEAALNSTDYSAFEFIGQTGTNITTTSGTYWTIDASNVRTTTTTYPSVSSASGATCTCTNLPKELHYTALTSSGTSISSVTLNGVFVTLEGTCTDTLVFEQKFSFTYKEEQTARVQSGSPGYHKGLNVLAGYADSSGTATNGFIYAKEQGFPLYGVNNDGMCLLTAAADTVIDPEAYNYYNDPTLTFSNGAMYG